MNATIMQWAIRHGVSYQALQELQGIFGMHGGHTMPKGHEGVSEAAAQSAIRLEAPRKGCHLFRNNVGALKDDRGVPVRYGLANDSKALNKVIKSGDLIGWRPVLIQPHHVGSVIAQFLSRECKPVDWRYTGTDHEVAQLNWAQLVMAHGGDAGFATGEGTL